MGHVKYTEGIYQLVFAPPSTAVPIHILQPENEMFTGWRAGQKVPRLGSFEANASLFKGGYSIEIRLPLASFPHKPASDRLNRPFGFEVMIADKDTGRPKGQPDRMYYSCSGYSGGGNYFKSPSTIACTDPELRTSLPLSRLRNNPLKNAPGGDECEGWIVTALNEQNVDSAFVQASGDVKGFVPSETQDKDRPFTTYPCPALGIAFHHRRVLDRLPALSPSTVGNRYLGVFPAGRQEIKVDGSLDDWDDFEKTAAVIHEYGCMPWCAGIEGKNDSASIKLMTANDTLYLFEEVRIWQQMLSELRPGAAMIRQFVSEKSNKWLMVHGQNFVKDRYGIPEVKISFFSDAAEGVLPTQRFWITKQFCDLTPTGNALQTSSDHPQVLVSGFSGKQGFRKVYTIHAANIGAARKAELIGLPKIKEMHIVRTTGGEGAHRVDDLKVKSGRIELDLPAWSLVTLTTMPPKTWDGP
jgi:hypothetical protein